MNTALEEYIQKRKDEMLIEAGLYEKVYYNKENGDNLNDFPELENTNDIVVHYKKVPVILSDEEYKEFIRYYKPQPNVKATAVAKALSAFAWIIYIAAVIIAIAGLSLGTILSLLPAIISAAIGGTVLLGLASVINLLTDINNK